ncbi:MAG: DUF6067 family protein [Kiritimatiellae bacterium]|nr:DUF6067 family protein [Kiritimatiellia bacterium]
MSRYQHKRNPCQRSTTDGKPVAQRGLSKSMLGCLLLVASLWTSAAWGITATHVLFYAPFDGTTDGRIAQGSKALTATTTATFVEGRAGKAVLVGGPGSELRYATAGNLDINAGSVAMWIKPVGWDKTDTYMRFYFRLHDVVPSGPGDSGDFVWLYKSFIYPALWLVQQDTYHREFYTVMPASGDAGGKVSLELPDGQWGHLIATWSGNQMAMYVNGQFVGANYVPTPHLIGHPAKDFIIGGKNLRDNGVPDTAIDEVLILDRPVKPAEARAIYEKGLAGLLSPRQDEAPYFSALANYELRQGRVELMTETVGWATNELRDAWYQYVIQDPRTAKVRLAGVAAATNLHQRILLDSPSLNAGAYAVHVQLVRTGRVIATSDTSLRVADMPEWLGNRIGEVQSVPAPWEPVRCNDTTLTCWGREYAWDAGAFPTQIKSQGQELLSRPITLSAKIDGQPVSIRKPAFKWNKVTDLRADFTFKGKLGVVPLTVKGYLEYDGFLWQEIALGGKSSTHTLDHLILEIPFDRAAAPLVNAGYIHPSGAVSKFNSLLAIDPVVWLGNDKGGLQWSTQDYTDWNLLDKTRMLAVEPGEKETVLRFTLVDQPTRLDGAPRRYAFGLQATPVKPIPTDWRAWALEAIRGCTWDLSKLPDNERSAQTYSQWNIETNQKDGPYGYLVANSNTYALCARLNARNLFPYLYWNTSAIWCGDDVLKTFAGWGEYQDNAAAYTSVRRWRTNPDMRDYMVWRCNKLFADNPMLPDKISGYYLDCAQAVWGKDGIFSLLGTRDFQRRAYLSVKARWPRLKFYNHQSGAPIMSQLAFADLMLTGENLTLNANLVADLNYYRVLSLEALRAEYMGRNYGIPMMFLPELARAVAGDAEKKRRVLGPEGIPAVEHLLGMLWVSDIPCTRDCINGDPVLQAYRVQMAFGWDSNTVFHGYWENNSLVQTKTTQSPVVTSVFTRNGKALFVTMNNSDADSEVELTPNWSALGMPAPAALVDAYAEQAVPPAQTTVPLADGCARFAVSARNFRVIVAR